MNCMFLQFVPLLASSISMDQHCSTFNHNVCKVSVVSYDFHMFRIQNESSSSLQRLLIHGFAKNVTWGDLKRLEGTKNIGK